MKYLLTALALLLATIVGSPLQAEDKEPKKISEREREKLTNEAKQIFEGINDQTRNKLTEYLNKSSDEDLKKIRGLKDSDIAEIKAGRPWGSPERIIFNEKLGRRALRDMADFAKNKDFFVVSEEKKDEDKDKKRERKNKDKDKEPESEGQ